MGNIVKKIGVYTITNLVNGKSYIGSSIDINGRWWGHLNGLRKGKHHNMLLQRAWNKYGEDSFEFKVIEVCSSEELAVREQFWLDKLEVYNSHKGYNLAPSVEHTTRGYKWRPESVGNLSKAIKLVNSDPAHRKILSEAAFKKFADHPELAQQHSERMKGRKNGPHSEETREKIAASKRGKPRPLEVVARIAEKLRGRKLGPHSKERRKAASDGMKRTYAQRRAEIGSSYPPERRQQMSEALRGRPAWNKGLTGLVCNLTPEQRSLKAQKAWKTRRATGADKWAGRGMPGRKWSAEQRAIKAEEVRARFRNPEARQLQSERLKAFYVRVPPTPMKEESKEKLSTSLCNVWATYSPEQRIARVQKTREARLAVN